MTGQGGSIREDSSRAVLTALSPGHTTKVGRKWPQYVAALIANLSALSVGNHFAWTSATQTPLTRRFGISVEEFSWIGAAMALGAFVGSVPAGAAADRLGRRVALLALSVPLLVTWVLLAFGAPSVPLLVTGRFIAGVASGAVTVLVPMYVAEVAHSTVRGTCGTFLQLQMVVGIVIGQMLGLFGSLLLIGLVCGLVPFVFAAAFYGMPESPVYLVSKGRLEEARRSILWLRGDKCDVDYEISRITIQVQESREVKATINDLFATKAARKAFLVSMGLMVAQQLSGINAVLFYTSHIFEAAGSTLSGELATLIVGLMQLASTYASTVFVDRAGRRVLLILSSSIMSFCLAVLGVYFHLKDANHNLSAMSWLPLATLALFIIAFSLGMGPLPWVVMGEIFPDKTKATASAVASASNWMLAFTVTKTFMTLNEVLSKGGTMWLFSSVCVFGTIFVIFLVPETKGKDSLQIQSMLEGKGNIDGESDDENEAVTSSKQAGDGVVGNDNDLDPDRSVVRQSSGTRDSENEEEPTRVVFTM